jgi:hypothetical protein
MKMHYFVSVFNIFCLVPTRLDSFRVWCIHTLQTCFCVGVLCNRQVTLGCVGAPRPAVCLHMIWHFEYPFDGVNHKQFKHECSSCLVYESGPGIMWWFIFQPACHHPMKTSFGCCVDGHQHFLLVCRIYITYVCSIIVCPAGLNIILSVSKHFPSIQNVWGPF